jgi:hypothetical protein
MTKDQGLRELLGNVTEFVEAPSLGFRVEVDQCDGDKSQNGVYNTRHCVSRIEMSL